MTNAKKRLKLSKRRPRKERDRLLTGREGEERGPRILISLRHLLISGLIHGRNTKRFRSGPNKTTRNSLTLISRLTAAASDRVWLEGPKLTNGYVPVNRSMIRSVLSIKLINMEAQKLMH